VFNINRIEALSRLYEKKIKKTLGTYLEIRTKFGGKKIKVEKAWHVPSAKKTPAIKLHFKP